MKNIFPELITSLPEVEIPLDGVTAYLSQADDHRIIFMQFECDVELHEHQHAAQSSIVVEGKIELTIDTKTQIYQKGDRYHIPEGVPHSAKIDAGYADLTLFAQPDSYTKRIIRDDCGRIDYSHYHKEARHLRSEEVGNFFQNIFTWILRGK